MRLATALIFVCTLCPTQAQERIQSQEPVVTVYHISDPSDHSEPYSVIGKKAYEQFKSLRKQRGAARVFDLYAVVDHGEKLPPRQLRFETVYSSKPVPATQ
jgi:hypothetical protein